MFFIRLRLRAGKGGSGIISWEKTKRNSRLGPAGGDGGDGASIFFICSAKFADFAHINTHIIVGENGKNGEKGRKSGSSAKNITVEVPLKTQIYNLQDKLWKNTLTSESNKYLICRGGRGGRGNASFKNSQFQAPWLYELGESGERKEILLVLEDYHQVGIFTFSGGNRLDEELSSKLRLSEPSCKLKCSIFSHSIFSKAEPKEVFLRDLELCKSFIFLLEEESQDYLTEREKIESKLREMGFNSFLTLVTFKTENPLLNGQFYNGEIDFILEWLKKELKNLNYLPVFKPKNDNLEEQEYIEYSDELFPEKEALNISKTDGGWEVQSTRLHYWTQRIPQTTLHNLERLRQKLKIEEINKEVKKLGGFQGEKLKIYNYSTHIY